MHERAVLRIDHPEPQQGMNGLHRIRPLLPMGQGGDRSLTDPFLGLMEDWFPRGVFDRHPHRGIETVTYVLEGELEHYDNQGNSGVVRPGEAQWMTAGRGVIHNEIPAEGVTVHSLQLWVNLPAAKKMTAPRYQELTAETVPVRHEPGVEVRVFSGSSGNVRAPTLNHAPVTMLELRIDPAATFRQELPPGDNAFLVILEGAGKVGGRAVNTGDVVFLERVEVASVVRLEGALRALLFSGRPLNEPVVAYGPFVMNSMEQIREAFADYQAGRFGA